MHLDMVLQERLSLEFLSNRCLGRGIMGPLLQTWAQGLSSLASRVGTAGARPVQRRLGTLESRRSGENFALACGSWHLNSTCPAPLPLIPPLQSPSIPWNPPPIHTSNTSATSRGPTFHPAGPQRISTVRSLVLGGGGGGGDSRRRL